LKNEHWKSYAEYVGIIIISGKGTKTALGANIAISHSRRKDIYLIFLVGKTRDKKMKIVTKNDRNKS
jgi:hypothetical protein